MNFDQILIKSDPNIDYLCKNILNTCQQFSKMSFYQNIINPKSKIIQDLDAEQIFDTSHFWTRKPKNYNIHIYHFHISELLNFDLSFYFCWGGLIN